MWDTAEIHTSRITRDPPCLGCGHGCHSYLPCDDTCGCEWTGMPGVSPTPITRIG